MITLAEYISRNGLSLTDDLNEIIHDNLLYFDDIMRNYDVISYKHLEDFRDWLDYQLENWNIIELNSKQFITRDRLDIIIEDYIDSIDRESLPDYEGHYSGITIHDFI